MLRRDFLKVAALTPLLTQMGLGKTEPAKPFSLPGLGVYVSHVARQHETWDELVDKSHIFENGQLSIFELPPEPPRRVRYPTYPWVAELVVRFVGGELRFTSYNCSRDLIRRMNAMGPHELFAGYEWKAPERISDCSSEWVRMRGEPPVLTLHDPISLVYEVLNDSQCARGQSRLRTMGRLGCGSRIPEKVAKFRLVCMSW